MTTAPGPLPHLSHVNCFPTHHVRKIDRNEKLTIIENGAFYNITNRKDFNKRTFVSLQVSSLSCCDMDWLAYDFELLLPYPQSSIVCGTPSRVRGKDLLVAPTVASNPGLYDPINRNPVCGCPNAEQFLVLPAAALKCVDECGAGYLNRDAGDSIVRVCDPCTYHHTFRHPKGLHQVDPNCLRCDIGYNPALVYDPSMCLECRLGFFLNPDQGCVPSCNATVLNEAQYGYRRSTGADGTLVYERCSDFANCNNVRSTSEPCVLSWQALTLARPVEHRKHCDGCCLIPLSVGRLPVAVRWQRRYLHRLRQQLGKSTTQVSNAHSVLVTA